jgi:molecular chaperone HtpG
MGDSPTTHEIRTDLRGLIRLLAKNLYSQPDAFLRELIQNAHDAIARRREIEGDRTPAGQIAIHVTWTRGRGTVTFEDNGAGMTEAEVHDYLATIGRSGTDEFRRALLDKGRYAAAGSLIGQFGIGLLSAFVVAERVIVQTRSCHPGQSGWRWECQGDKNYTLTPDPDAPLGSRVTLDIDEAHRDVLDHDFVRQAVRKYADFLPVPIVLNGEARINTVDAPWHRSYAKDEDRVAEYLAFIDRRFPDLALSVIPVDIDEPYPVKGVLYISDRRSTDLAAPGRVDVYQARMFIVADHGEMVPAWAKFVRGVIDSPSLTPTASRENIQQDTVSRAVREALGRLIIDHLKEIARDDPRRFQDLMEWHAYHIKGMALEAGDFFSEVAELLPFETNRGSMSLREYLARSAGANGGRPRILYFSERGQATQFFLLADAREVLVINAGYAHESEFLRKYAKEHPEIQLELLDFAESAQIFQPLPPAEARGFRDLLAAFNASMQQVGSVAKVVRFRPAEIPAVVTMTEAQMLRRNMEALKDHPVIPAEIRALVGQVMEGRPTPPVVLHINADNPTIRALAMMDLHSEVGENAIAAIGNNALLLAQHSSVTPRKAESMLVQSNRVIDLLIDQVQQADQLRQRVASLEKEAQTQRPREGDGLTAHVSCFVAFDFDARSHFFDCLRQILQDRPYFWEVVRADASVEHSDLLTNLYGKMSRSHCCVVELSERNPNVMLELGLVLAMGRPYLLLWDQNAQLDKDIADLAGKLRQDYDGRAPAEAMSQQLAEALRRHRPIQALVGLGHPKYLSSTIMRVPGIESTPAQAICGLFSTVEQFLAADAVAVAQRIQYPAYIVHALQEHVRNYCEG